MASVFFAYSHRDEALPVGGIQWRSVAPLDSKVAVSIRGPGRFGR